MKGIKDFEKKYEELYNSGIEYIIEEARKILRKHKNLDEFIMGMGTWFFTYKDGSIVYDVKYINESRLVKFVNEYDDSMKFTGTSIRFSANSKIRKAGDIS